MKNINITVENKRATVVGSPVIICGNSDYTVTFAFDSDWNVTGVRTARFVYVKDGKVQHEDKVFSGNTVAVPILSGIDSVKIGVFAGELRTTTPAVVRCGASILCGSGEVHEPTPDVYDQIMALFNDLAERGGFGATEAQAQQIAQNQADIAALVSGTKKAGKAASADQATNATNAGNANALGGHAPDYFAKRGFGLGSDTANDATADTIITDLNNATKCGWYYVSDSVTANTPSGFSKAAIVLVSARSNAGICQEYLDLANKKSAKRFLYGGSWTEWVGEATLSDLANYLPLTGGTVTGDINQKVDTETFIMHQLRNAKRNVYFQVAPDGGFYLYDATVGKYIFNANLAGGYTWQGTASGSLSLVGGTVGDGSALSALKVKGTTAALLGFLNSDNGVLGYLGFNASGNPIYQDSINAGHSLLHTGNSAKVHIGTSAPSDTSALWIDTSA